MKDCSTILARSFAVFAQLLLVVGIAAPQVNRQAFINVARSDARKFGIEIPVSEIPSFADAGGPRRQNLNSHMIAFKDAILSYYVSGKLAQFTNRKAVSQYSSYASDAVTTLEQARGVFEHAAVQFLDPRPYRLERSETISSGIGYPGPVFRLQFRDLHNGYEALGGEYVYCLVTKRSGEVLEYRATEDWSYEVPNIRITQSQATATAHQTHAGPPRTWNTRLAYIYDPDTLTASALASLSRQRKLRLCYVLGRREEVVIVDSVTGEVVSEGYSGSNGSSKTTDKMTSSSGSGAAPIADKTDRETTPLVPSRPFEKSENTNLIVIYLILGTAIVGSLICLIIHRSKSM